MARQLVSKAVAFGDPFANADGGVFTVYIAGVGSNLATLYNEKTGGTLKNNPFTVGADSIAEFYINPGLYRLEFLPPGEVTPVVIDEYLVLDENLANAPTGGLQFATIDDLKSGTPINANQLSTSTILAFVGQKVSTVVNNTISKKGGAEYIIKTAAQASTDGDVIDGYGNHYLLGGTSYCAIILPKNGVVTDAQFGVLNDGSDSSAAINAALSFHATKGIKLLFTLKSTHISALTCVTSNAVDIEFVSDASISTSASMTDDTALWISWLPYLAAASRDQYWDKSLRTGGVALSVNATGKQDRVITVADGSSFSAGDYIRIASTEQYVNTRTQYDKGELRKIGQVAGNVITLDGVLDDSYLAAQTTVFRLEPPKVTIKNLNLIGPDNENSYQGLILWECRSVNLESPSVAGYNDAGIEPSFCNGYIVNNANADFSQKTYVGSSRKSYSFSSVSSRDGFILGGQFRGGRHSFATSGYDPNRNITVDGATIYSNDIDGNDVAAMDSHENMDTLKVSNCKIYGGVNIAGQNVNFSKNEVYLSGEALRVCEIRVAASCEYMRMNENVIVSEDGACIGGLVLRPIDDSVIVKKVEQNENVVIIDTAFARPGIGIEPASAGTNFKIEHLSQNDNQVSVSGTGNSPGIGNYDTAELADADRPIISHHVCRDNYVVNENWRCIDFDPNPASGDLHLSDNTCSATTGNSGTFNIRRYKNVYWTDNVMRSNSSSTTQNVFNSIAGVVSLRGGLITYSNKNGFDATGLDVREVGVERENCTVDDADWIRRNAKFVAHSWASVTSAGVVLDSYRCTVTRTGVGLYRVTFDTGNRQLNSTDYPVITTPTCTYARVNFNAVNLNFGSDTDFSFLSF